MNFEGAHDAGAVRGHSLRTQTQLGSDFSARFPIHNELQNLKLALRQAVFPFWVPAVLPAGIGWCVIH